jgi:hypothetical protein
MGALGTRHSLRPLFSRDIGSQNSGASRRESVGLCLIGCLKIQSTPSSSSRRNDLVSAMADVEMLDPLRDVGHDLGKLHLSIRTVDRL